MRPEDPISGAGAALPVSREYAPEERLVCLIEFTNACNFRCPICPQAYRYAAAPQPTGAVYDRSIGQMSEAVFRRCVEEANRVARMVDLGFFGEQTLHAKYAEFMRYLGRNRKFKIETNTNVSLVDEAVMRLWVETGVDLIRLSLDAVHPEVFDRARPGSMRDLAGRAVKDRRMAAMNEKVHHWLAMPDHCPTRLVFVQSQHNPDEAPAFVDYWQRYLGPHDHILIKRVLSYGGKVADPAIEVGRCNVWDVRYFQINHRGDASPCNLDINTDLRLGNIMEQSIDQMYTGERASELRRKTGGSMSFCVEVDVCRFQLPSVRSER